MGGSGGAGGDAGGMGGSGGTAPFELTSTAFMDDEVVPLQYKCAQPNNNPPGMNQSPPLSWGPGPEGTMSYAIAMRHLDVPYHWVIWDIPANVTSLPEDIDHEFEPADVPGAKQTYVNGLDDFTGFGYLGPCPQATNSEQSYEFSLYALDVATIPGLTGMVSPDQALAAVEDNMVDGSEAMLLIGRQTRVP
jgi:Raf kinase inhibitor-like YbhB/YbcL family protein